MQISPQPDNRKQRKKKNATTDQNAFLEKGT